MSDQDQPGLFPAPPKPAHYKAGIYLPCTTHPEPDDATPEWDAWYDEHFWAGDEEFATCEASRCGDICGPCTEKAQDRLNDGDVQVAWPCSEARAGAT